MLGWLRRHLGLRIYRIYTRPLRPRPPLTLEPGFSFRMFDQAADEAALVAAARNPALGMSADFIRRALEKGDACDAVLYGEQIVAYSWSAFSPTHDEHGVFVEARASDRYGYKAFTLPEYRGRHLRSDPPYDNYCIARGCTDVIMFVDVTNRSSARLAQAQGGSQIGYAGYVKRGGFFRSFRTPAVRRRGFGFFVPQCFKGV